MAKNGEEYKKRIERSVSAVMENEAEFHMSNYIESAICQCVNHKQEYLDSFTPVILAGGQNTRFGEVSKPLQTIMGRPSIARTIDQLNEAGFKDHDIYVVTALSNDYRSEPFWYFLEGDGKSRKINHVTFHDEPFGMAGVVKRFADGELEEAKYDDFDGWCFVQKEPILKKNLLVLAADTVFYSHAPMLWFTETGGEALSDPSNGYCLFEMLGMKGQRCRKLSKAETEDKADKELTSKRAEVLSIISNEAYYAIDKAIKGKRFRCKTDYDYKMEKGVCAYAINKKAYSELELPQDDTKIEDFIGKAMEKNGITGKRAMLECNFFNINDTTLYNTAIYAELKGRDFCKINRIVRAEGDIIVLDFLTVKREKGIIAEHEYILYKELDSKIGDANKKTGQEVGCESGLNAYMKGHVEDPSVRFFDFDGDDANYLTKIYMDNVYFYLGLLISADEEDFIGKALKEEAGRCIKTMIREQEETAPELGEYVEKTIELGMAKKGRP